MIEEIKIITKTCAKCREYKPITSFYKSAAKNLYGYCIECSRVAQTRARERLSDGYMINHVLLKGGYSRKDITPELIEERRFQIRAKRKINKLFGNS